VNRQILCGGITAIAMLASSAAFAQGMKMKADLTGAQEVPPVTTQGKGSAEVTFDPASKQLSWTVNYSGLSGPATAAHFHGPAEPGKNAGVAVPIPNQAKSPVTGLATLTDAQAADLQAGRYYVNIHTAANPGGEIRGQVTK
jgi:CHRD domain